MTNQCDECIKHCDLDEPVDENCSKIKNFSEIEAILRTLIIRIEELEYEQRSSCDDDYDY